MFLKYSDYTLYFTLLLLGVLSASTSFIFIRESSQAPAMLASHRLLLTVVILSPLLLRDYRKYPCNLKSLITPTLLPGLILALHFITWNIGARITLAANATLIVNLVPLVMPVFMLFLYHENISRKEIAATTLALSGLLILSASDLSISTEHLLGDLVCFVSMVLFGFYLALARKSTKQKTLWLYLVPMYLVAGIFCFLLALLYSSPFQPYNQKDIYMLLGLALIPTVAGHSIFNFCMQKLRGQTVSIMTMGQFVFAAVFAAILYDEIPETQFYIAVFVFSVSVLLVISKE